MLDYKKLFISPDATIKQALKKLDETGERHLFIVDGEDVLMGVLTDGDVRRWVLDNKSINESVDKVMNRNPKFVRGGDILKEVKRIIIKYKIGLVPELDKEGRIVGVYEINDLFPYSAEDGRVRYFAEKLNCSVVIMAGGKGTRLEPYTKVIPKPLFPIGDKPIIEVIMNSFHNYGIDKFYVSVNYKADMIRAYFAEQVLPYKIEYIQEDRPLGTAGSLFILKKRLKGTLFIINCDTLIKANLLDILNYHKKQGNEMTLVCAMKDHHIPYGIVHVEDGGHLKEFQEKPQFNFLVNTGAYIVETGLLQGLPDNSFYHFTHWIEELRSDGARIGVYPVSEQAWFDMGQWEEYKKNLSLIEDIKR